MVVKLFSNMLLALFFFFKQKTAYEIRPRDWSSDVCSSDHIEHSPLHLFGQHIKPFVDFGLFFFAFTSAGVQLDRKSVV